MGCFQSKKDQPCCQNCNSTKILIENVYCDESRPADFYCRRCQNSPCPNCNTSQHVIKIETAELLNESKDNEKLEIVDDSGCKIVNDSYCKLCNLSFDGKKYEIALFEKSLRMVNLQ